MAAYRIPSDVIVEILVHLPVISLQRFKSVCKDWYTLINSPLFIQLHLNKSLLFTFPYNHTVFYTNEDYLCVVDDIYRPSKPIKVDWPEEIIRNGVDVHVAGSCNGLVCLCFTTVITNDTLFDSKVLCFLICNPSTRTFKFKPSFPFSELKCSESQELLCGFGYDGEHDDYKIVVTLRVCKENAKDDDVYIYSCKADSWKYATHTHAEGSSRRSYYYLKVDDRVVYGNNMLHYIVFPFVDDYYNDPKYRIARFDLSSETWRDDLSFPVGVKDWRYVELRVWDDCLYLCLSEDNGSNNIWVMKGNRDEGYSWSIKYTIPANLHNLTLFVPLKDGPLRLLFVYNDFGNVSGTTHRLLWYNTHDATTETFKVKLEKSSSDSLLCHCITSLVTIPGSSFNYGAPRK